MTKPLTLFIVGSFPRDAARIEGGVQASVYGLATALLGNPAIAQIHGISVPTHPGKTVHREIYQLASIPVLPLDAPGGFLSSAATHIASVVKMIEVAKNPLVHLHGTGTLQLGMMQALRKRNIPFVWTLHGITEFETRQKLKRRPTLGNLLRYPLYRSIERQMLRLASHIIVDTEYVRQALPKRYAAKMTVIPQGIFLHEFAVPHSSSNGRMPASPIILSLGVIDARKGHHLTIEAFQKVRETHPEARLFIAGILKDTAYAWKLHQQIASNGLLQYAQLRSNLQRMEIIALLARASVVTLHSREESQGIALCEALAAGAPVVASRIGGIPYVVTEGEDGYLFPYGDTTAQAGAINTILNDAKEVSRLSSHGRENARRFDWQHIAASVLAIYEAAVTTTKNQA